jgi:phosphotransferase system  glucose/maltose/N-acetylglucosamine-specific IIC component
VAGAKAKLKVLELLRGLSSELQSKINILVFASMLLIVAKALFAHVRLGSHIFNKYLQHYLHICDSNLFHLLLSCL